MIKGLFSPQLGLFLLGVATTTAIACNETNGPDDATGGMGGTDTGGRTNSGGTGTGGAGTGGVGTGGLGGNGGEGPTCTPKLYGVAELCLSDNFAGGYVSSSIPDDPLNNPSYVCSAGRPDVDFLTPLFRYREGCGLSEWEVENPGPPWATLVWRTNTEKLIGCTYGEDFPLEDQCGDHSRHAGLRFKCEDFEERICVLADGSGGEGGMGPD